MSRVVICGFICNNDVALSELLLRYGIDVKIIRPISKRIDNFASFSGKLDRLTPDKISYVASSLEFVKEIIFEKCFISISGAANGMISPWWDLVYKLPGMPKIINLTSGSDITEFARENNLNGRRYRKLIRNSFHNYISPYPEAIKTIQQLKVPNYTIMRCPYYLMEKWNGQQFSIDGPIHFFHASNLDWGVTDDNPKRNSTKGNDKFIKAMARAIQNGMNLKCTMLDRGPDRKEAKKLIASLGVSEYFTFLPSLTQGELQESLLKADIVVDQFDVGFAGGIAYEAMALAKPVMVYINEECWPLVYNDKPPVLNCYTEQNIYDVIVKWNNRGALQKLGESAERWVRKYHNVHQADFSEFILRICIAAGFKWPQLDSNNQL